MRNERAWPQQCWKSCANGSNIVALRFGDHRTKEMLEVVGWKVWPVSNFAQQHPTTCNRVWKRTQHVTSNNFGSCWPTMLRPFAWGFKLHNVLALKSLLFQNLVLPREIPRCGKITKSSYAACSLVDFFPSVLILGTVSGFVEGYNFLFFLFFLYRCGSFSLWSLLLLLLPLSVSVLVNILHEGRDWRKWSTDKCNNTAGQGIGEGVCYNKC